jgi:hypothetical protein
MLVGVHRVYDTIVRKEKAKRLFSNAPEFAWVCHAVLI